MLRYRQRAEMQAYDITAMKMPELFRRLLIFYGIFVMLYAIADDKLTTLLGARLIIISFTARLRFISLKFEAMLDAWGKSITAATTITYTLLPLSDAYHDYWRY